MRFQSCLFGAILLLLIAVPGSSQDKKEPVVRTVSSEMLERVLSELKIQYTKTKARSPNTYFYDYEQNNYKMRLGNHAGKVLWLVSGFPKTSLEKINQWNVDAKFSRAVLDTDNKREAALVEAQLDCAGGVTPAMIRQLCKRFADEVHAFDQFLAH